MNNWFHESGSVTGVGTALRSTGRTKPETSPLAAARLPAQIAPPPPIRRGHQGEPALTPEEFRRIGHQLIDRIADYRSSVAERPVMSANAPGALRAALPKEAPLKPEAVRRDLQRSRRADHPRALALAVAAILRLFPRQQRAFLRARRLSQHGARRARPLLAGGAGADRARGGGGRLDAPAGRALRRAGAASSRTRRRPARWSR